jgi:4-cresol dehydrogenase (hydroxylating)
VVVQTAIDEGVPMTLSRGQVATEIAAAAFKDLVGLLGAEAVLSEDASQREYGDPFTFAGWHSRRIAATVLPSSVAEVQEIVRIAGRHGFPLWVISQGRNNAYGGAAPRVPGSVLVSLRRMNRVLEVDEEHAVARVEPGVRFFDLYDHLRTNGHRLWSSAPDLGWGSVIGNALEHGVGYTVHGDHAARLCGLEVVLPDGEVIRTGMGAMEGNRSWNLRPRGFGPTMDGLFGQSNLGIVTKAGVWMMPEPESYLAGSIRLPRRQDLPALIEAIRPLFLEGTVQNPPAIGHPAFLAGLVPGAPSRREVHDGPGPIPETTVIELARRLDVGRWTMRFALYGTGPVVAARFERVRRAVSHIEGVRVDGETFPGHAVHELARDQNAQVQAGIPSLDLMKALDWYSGPGGGHIDFSVVAPLRGGDIVRLHDLLDGWMSGTGLDFDCALILGQRYAINVMQIYFHPEDEATVARVWELYPQLIRAAAAEGFALYRTHLDFMDIGADQFDAGGHAQLRFHERLKDALDPHGVLAPGKQGVWPKSYRSG